LSPILPLNYLVLIGEIDVLPRLFREVILPPTVRQELQQPGTPAVVHQWAANLPSWARVQAPITIDKSLVLDKGEAEAISLAKEIGAQSILIDEKRGRAAAKERGLMAIPVLTVLDVASRRGLLNLEEAIRKLRQTSFHVAEAILEELIRRSRERK
jgi:predicted nucleic acid-binding protein